MNGIINFEINNVDVTSNDYVLVDVEGLNPPSISQSITKYAGGIGGTRNGRKVDDRQIILTFKILHNHGTARQTLYDMLGGGEEITLTFRQGKGTDNWYEIKGYLQSIECSAFSESAGLQTLVASFICPYPYFVAEYITDTFAPSSVNISRNIILSKHSKNLKTAPIVLLTTAANNVTMINISAYDSDNNAQGHVVITPSGIPANAVITFDLRSGNQDIYYTYSNTKHSLLKDVQTSTEWPYLLKGTNRIDIFSTGTKFSNVTILAEGLREGF